MTRTMMVILLGVTLAGCSTLTAFDKEGCPQERKYTKAENDAFLAAWPKTPPVMKDALGHYSDLRRQSRACRGEGQ